MKVGMKAAMVLCVLAVGVPGLTSCKKKPAATALKGVSMKTYPDTVEGLKQLVTDMAAAAEKDKPLAEVIADSFTVTDEWFLKNYGDETGKRLAEEWKAAAAALKDLPGAVSGALKAGKTEILVERFDTPDDKKATAWQQTALRESKEKFGVYSVRLLAPTKKRGLHLYSFIYLDGSFRFVGKLTAIDKTVSNPATKAILELRQSEAEEMLTHGAVDE